ncbi:MAG: ABC transporter permease [Chlamydiota bacterium]
MNKSIQFFGLLQREIRRYFKVPLQTIGAPIMSVGLYLVIFGISLGAAISLSGGTSYLAFLIPGLVAMECIKDSFDNSVSALLVQKYGNELQDLRTTPLSIGQICAAKAIASFTRGLLVSTITFVVGELFYFLTQKTLLTVAAPGVLAFFIFFGGLTFSCLGIAIGMWAKNFEDVGGFSLMIFVPLMYLGGVFFNLSMVAPFWRTLSRFNPLFYIINGIRYGFLGKADSDLIASALFTFLFFILCYILALTSLSKGRRYLR